MPTGSRKEQRRKRQEETSRASRRTREVKNRTLIVVEGEKSERLYLYRVIELMGLQSESVDIDNRAGTCPLNMLNRAKLIYDQSITSSIYDKVFIVFDRDSHGRFDEARELYKSCDKAVFTLIISYPCLEYWFLLHSGYFDKPFAREGSKSPCDCATHQLKQAFGIDDGKDYKELIRILNIDLIKQAVANSKLSQKRTAQDGNPNPSTNFHKLIEYFFRCK